MIRNQKPILVCTSHHDTGKFTASWSKGDFRFHVWIRDDGTITGKHDWRGGEYLQVSETLYKNKIDNVKYGEDGHYDTRQLDFGAKTHSEARAAVVELIESTDFEQLRRDEENRCEDRAAEIRKQDAEKIRTNLIEWVKDNDIDGEGNIGFTVKDLALTLNHGQLFDLRNKLRR